jgi:calpain
VSKEEKARLRLEFQNDGEFWMSFKDFKANFTNLEICNLGPQTSFDEDTTCDTGKKCTSQNRQTKQFQFRLNSNYGQKGSVCAGTHWEENIFEGAWISGVTAGGCRNNLQTYAMNPQYLITLVDRDEGDGNDQCTLILALMQKNRRSQRRMGLDTLTIGFAVYSIQNSVVDTSQDLMMEKGFVRRQLLDTEFFKYNKSIARSPSYINLREVITRVKLPPGRYCIVPSTFDPNEEGEFILRIFTEKPPKDCIENDDEVGIISGPAHPVMPDNPDGPSNDLDVSATPN